MEAKLQKWGNSLGIRIPSSILKSLNLEQEDILEIKEDGEKIIICKSKKNKISLAERFKKYKCWWINKFKKNKNNVIPNKRKCDSVVNSKGSFSGGGSTTTKIKNDGKNNNINEENIIASENENGDNQEENDNQKENENENKKDNNKNSDNDNDSDSDDSSEEINSSEEDKKENEGNECIKI